MKILSALLLPRWEEEVERGNIPPPLNPLPRRGEEDQGKGFHGGRAGGFSFSSRLTCRPGVFVFSGEPCYVFAARGAFPLMVCGCRRSCAVSVRGRKA